jgi:subfamily B ATP-binding cassette protein MsbA
MSSQLKISKYEIIQAPSMEIIVSFALAGALYTSQRNQVPLSTFLSIFAALYFAFDPIKQMLKVFTQASRCNAPAQRLEELLKANIDLKDPEKPISIHEVKGNITFDKISFSYGEEPVLKDLSLSIKAGSFTALVGPSGSGKSTITRLIPRFYDPNSGTVLLDGIDLKSMNQKELRDKIAIVSQRPVLFNDSVLNNILIGKSDASYDEVMDAARSAHAHQFITENLKEGYDTIVGERGSKLSGGQLQRISIARAFLKDAPILVLDEATSALDSESEKLIQDALQKLSKDKTVIAVAHRLSTIKNSDCICYIESGRLKGSGGHDELYAELENYRNLVDLQGIKN